MFDNFNLNNFMYTEEEKPTSSNITDGTVDFNFIDNLLAPTLHTAKEEPLSLAIKPIDFKDIDVDFIDATVEPLIKIDTAYNKAKEQSEKLSFLDSDIKKNKYIEHTANLDLMEKEAPEQYKILQDTFDENYYQQFVQGEIPEDTLKLFEGIKNLTKNSKVIATPNGHGTLFSILMEGQLKTEDQIKNDKTDFYYLMTDKDFRKKVMDSVQDEATKELFSNILESMDKNNEDKPFSFIDTLYDPKDAPRFFTALMQNMPNYALQAVNVLSDGKTIGGALASTLGAGAVGTFAVTQGAGLLLTASIMGATGAFLESEERDRTEGQIQAIDMIVGVRDGKYTQLQVDNAAKFKLKPEYIDPNTGEILKDKVDADTEDGIKTSLTTPLLTPYSVHKYNLEGGFLASPKRNFDYTWVESAGDLSAEIIGSLGIVGLKFAVGAIKPLLRGDTSTFMNVAAFSLLSTHSIVSNYAFDVAQAMIVPEIMKNQYLSDFADYNFLTKPLAYRVANLAPNLITGKLAGKVFGSVANMSKAQESRFADGLENFSKMFGVQLKFAQIFNDKSVSADEALKVNEQVKMYGEQGVKLSNMSDLKQLVLSGGADRLLAGERLFQGHAERVQAIESSRDYRSLGDMHVVKESFDSDDHSFIKNLLGLKNVNIEDAELMKVIYTLGSDFNDSVFVGKEVEGTPVLVKHVNVSLNVSDDAGNTKQVNTTVDLTSDKLGEVLTKYFSNDVTKGAVKDKIEKFSNFSKNFSDLRQGLNAEKTTEFFEKQGLNTAQIEKLRLGQFTNESIDSFKGILSESDLSSIKGQVAMSYGLGAPTRAKDGIVSMLKQHIYNIINFNELQPTEPSHKLSTAISVASSAANIADNPTRLQDLSKNTSNFSENICKNMFKMINEAFEALDQFSETKLASGEDSTIMFKDTLGEFQKVKEEFQKLNPELTGNFNVDTVKDMSALYKSIIPLIKFNLISDYGQVLSDFAKLSAIVKNPMKAASSLQPGEEETIIEKMFMNKNYETDLKPIIDDFIEKGPSSILNTLAKMKDTSIGDDPSILDRFRVFKTFGWNETETVNKTVQNLRERYEALKEGFPDLFVEGKIDLDKLQDKLNNVVSLEDFTNRVNMQMQARGYISANPNESSASLLTTWYKISSLSSKIAENIKNKVDTTDDVNSLKNQFDRIKYINTLRGAGAKAATDIAFSAINTLTAPKFGNKGISFALNRLQSMRESSIINPIYKLMFGDNEASTSIKESAILLGVDGLVRDAIHTDILRALGFDDVQAKVATDAKVNIADNAVLKILDESKEAYPVKNLANEEARKSFIDILDSLSPHLNYDYFVKLKELMSVKDNQYINYVKAQQSLVNLLGKTIAKTLSSSVKQSEDYVNKDFSDNKQLLSDLGIDVSKIDANKISEKEIFDNLSVDYIKQLVKSSGTTKKLEDSIRGMFNTEVDAEGKASEFLKHEAKNVLGEKLAARADEMSGKELVNALTTLYMHEVNKKQVFSAYEAFGFGSENTSNITFKQAYNNLLDATSNAPLKLLMLQFNGVHSMDSNLKHLLASFVAEGADSFSFVKKMAMINQTLSDYKETLESFKNSPILAAVPEELKTKLISSIEYGFNEIDLRVKKYKEEYSKADAIKKESLLVSSGNYFKNLSKVFDITSRVTKSFMDNMTELAKEKDGILSDSDIAKALNLSLQTVSKLNIHSIKSALFSSDDVLSNNSLLSKPHRMIRHTYLSILNSGTMMKFLRNVADPYYGLSDTYKAMIKKVDNERSDLYAELHTAHSLILNPNDPKSIRDMTNTVYSLITAVKGTAEEQALLSWYKPTDTAIADSTKVELAKKAFIGDILGLDLNNEVDKLAIDNHFKFMESANKAGILDIILDESVRFTTSRDFYNAQKMAKGSTEVTSLDKIWTDTLEEKIRARVGDEGLTSFKASAKGSIGDKTNTVDAFNVATLMHSDFINNLMYSAIYNDKLFGVLKDSSPKIHEAIKQVRGVLKKVAGYGIVNGEIGVYEGANTPLEKLNSYLLENNVSSREKLINNPIQIQRIMQHLRYYSTVQDDAMLKAFETALEAGDIKLSERPTDVKQRVLFLQNIGSNFTITLNSKSEMAQYIARAAITASTADEKDPNFLMFVLGDSSGIKLAEDPSVPGKFTLESKDSVYAGTPEELTNQFLKYNNIGLQVRVHNKKENLERLKNVALDLQRNANINQLDENLLKNFVEMVTIESNTRTGERASTAKYSSQFLEAIDTLKNNYFASQEETALLPQQQVLRDKKAAIYKAIFDKLAELDYSASNKEQLPLLDDVNSMYLLGQRISVVVHNKKSGTEVPLDKALQWTMNGKIEEAEGKFTNALKKELDEYLVNIKPDTSGNKKHETETQFVNTIKEHINRSVDKSILLELPIRGTDDSKIIKILDINIMDDKLASEGVKAATTEQRFKKADLVITAEEKDGSIVYMPLSLKAPNYEYIDGSSKTFWNNSVVSCLAKGVLNKLSTAAGRAELGIEDVGRTKKASTMERALDEGGTDFLINIAKADPDVIRQGYREMMEVPAILRSFGALIQGTDFDAALRHAQSPFTEKGATAAFNRAFYFIRNNEHIYEMYKLYKQSDGDSEAAKNAILKLAGMVGIEKNLDNRDAIINKVKLTIASEMLANEKNSNPWMSNYISALKDNDKMKNLTETYLKRLLGVGVNNPNASSSIVEIYKNFMQLGKNEVEKEVFDRDKSLEDSMMESLVSGVYGSMVKLDPSFEPIMAFKKDPFSATSDTIKAMFDSIKLKEWASNIARDTGAIKILDYSGIYASPEDKEADRVAEENGTIKVMTLQELSKMGVVGKELIGIIEKMPEVRSKILDLMVQHELKTSTTNIKDPEAFKESALNKFFDTFNIGKQLEGIKISIAKDFWDEIEFMKEMYTPEVKGTGFGAKLLDSFQQLTSYFGVNFSGVVLITNHVSWLRNLFGAYLQPALSLGSWRTGIAYSTRAISAIIAARDSKGAQHNKDVALYEEFLKYNPRKPLSLARQGDRPFTTPTSKLDREKHHIFKTANTIVNKPMEVINKGIFNAAAKLWGTDPHLLEANLRGAYGMIDDITKFAIWMAAKEGRVSAPEDWSSLAKMFNRDSELSKSAAKIYSTDIVDTIKSNGKYLKAMSSEDAARYANKFSFLYDGLPPAWSLVKNVWNPFASFTYNSYRIAHNSMKTYPTKVLATYLGVHLFNELFLKGQYGMSLDFGSFVPNMDAFSHLPFVGGRPEDFNITNPSAPFIRFFRMLMEQKDPFTGKSMENMSGLEQLVRSYTTSFVPVSPTLNAAVRTGITLAREGLGMNDTNLAKTGLMGTILSLMPESYIHKKMVEEGFLGRPIDKFGTTVNPLFGTLYGVFGLNFKLEDKAKSRLIVNQYNKTRKNLETQLKKLKQTDMMRTNKDIQYQITSLESRLKALTNRTVEAFDDVFGEVPPRVKEAYIGTSFNPADYISAAWMSMMRSVWEDYGKSADYSVMRR